MRVWTLPGISIQTDTHAHTPEPGGRFSENNKKPKKKFERIEGTSKSSRPKFPCIHLFSVRRNPLNSPRFPSSQPKFPHWRPVGPAQGKYPPNSRGPEIPLNPRNSEIPLQFPDRLSAAGSPKFPSCRAGRPVNSLNSPKFPKNSLVVVGPDKFPCCRARARNP